MLKKFGLALGLAFTLSACNLYGGLSKPSSDEQYLSAARACLDQGDYTCAKENYQALSSNYNDVKISETGLTVLAQDHIFSISDLVASLGTSLGSASSFSQLAETLAARGITSGTYRTSLKTVYDNDAAIVEPNLRSFSRFIAALGMFNEVLANAVGPSGKLTAASIVNPATLSVCRTGGGPTSPASPTGCVLSTNCSAPPGTALTFNAGESISMSTPGGNWSSGATIQKLLAAATAASGELATFAHGSSNQGLLNTINQLGSISQAEPCARYLLIQYLNL